jgi:large subunit ribosomal protein L25
MNAKTAETLVKKASVNNTLVQVKIPDMRWSGKALLREVQTHPWKSSLYHLSFFSVAAQDSLEVTVPLSFVGDSPAVKEGGSLDTVLTELQVECAPDNIPESIEIDVSQMNIGDTLYVHELVLPSGVTVLGDSERVVVSAIPPRVTAEEEDTEAEAEAESGSKSEPEPESTVE